IQGGTLTLPAGSTLNGIVYMMGTSQKTITSAVGGDRATLRGGLLVDGKLYMQGPINVVYDQRNIRAAGFAAGSFAPLPGSWNDTWSVQ
ncbi:MAG: hypothetical protein L0H29_03600, partial [Sinobacteraceae bacterium]|nr:hypothetical protein [Nevskiaceae bacterium]